MEGENVNGCLDASCGLDASRQAGGRGRALARPLSPHHFTGADESMSTPNAREQIHRGRAMLKQAIGDLGQTTEAEKLALAAKLGELGRRIIDEQAGDGARVRDLVKVKALLEVIIADLVMGDE